MKLNSPFKKKLALLDKGVTLVEASSPHKSAVKSKGQAVRDKVIDGAIVMSATPFDYYKFLKELSEQNELGLTTQEMVSLTYEGTTSPWYTLRKCSCRNDSTNTGLKLCHYLSSSV